MVTTSLNDVADTIEIKKGIAMDENKRNNEKKFHPVGGKVIHIDNEDLELKILNLFTFIIQI